MRMDYYINEDCFKTETYKDNSNILKTLKYPASDKITDRQILQFLLDEMGITIEQAREDFDTKRKK